MLVHHHLYGGAKKQEVKNAQTQRKDTYGNGTNPDPADDSHYDHLHEPVQCIRGFGQKCLVFKQYSKIHGGRPKLYGGHYGEEHRHTNMDCGGWIQACRCGGQRSVGDTDEFFPWCRRYYREKPNQDVCDKHGSASEKRFISYGLADVQGYDEVRPGI